jgi:hypothetical protein
MTRRQAKSVPFGTPREDADAGAVLPDWGQERRLAGLAAVAAVVPDSVDVTSHDAAQQRDA